MKTILLISPYASPAPQTAPGERTVSAHGAEFRILSAPTLAEARPLLPLAGAIVYQGCALAAPDLEQATECLAAIHGGPGTGGTDLEAARYLGILVTSEPTAFTAQYTALASSRITGAINRGLVTPPAHRPPRIGLVGIGVVARAVTAELVKAGWSVWAHDPFAAPSHFDLSRARRAELNDLFGACEVISVHRPADASGRPAVGPAQIDLMMPGAAIINTSPAELVDLDAALAGLRAGKIGYAALTRPTPAHQEFDSTDLIASGRLEWLDTNFAADPAVATSALNAACDTAMHALLGKTPEHLLIDPPLPRLLSRAVGIVKLTPAP